MGIIIQFYLLCVIVYDKLDWYLDQFYLSCIIMCDKFNKKIINNETEDIYIIFYSKWCKYSMDALSLMETNKKQFKGYDIDKIKGNLPRLLDCLQKNANITSFNIEHKTRPIIFYKGKFIGGYSELLKVLQ